MFVQIDEQRLILKMVKRDVFLTKPKYEYYLSHEENVFMVPNHKKKGDYYANPCLSNSMNKH